MSTENHGPDLDAIMASRETSYAILDVASRRLIAEQEKCRKERRAFVPEKIITELRLLIGSGKL